jgi:hypothetical protein
MLLGRARSVQPVGNRRRIGRPHFLLEPPRPRARCRLHRHAVRAPSPVPTPPSSKVIDAPLLLIPSLPVGAGRVVTPSTVPLLLVAPFCRERGSLALRADDVRRSAPTIDRPIGVSIDARKLLCHDRPI